MCVCKVTSHFTNEQLSYMHTWWRMNVKKFVGICLKQLCSRVMPRKTSKKTNMLIYWLTRCQLSPLDARVSVTGYPGIVNCTQPHPKRRLLMLLACVGVRTDSTTRAAIHNAGCGQFPRTLIGFFCNMRQGFYTLVLFI